MPSPTDQSIAQLTTSMAAGDAAAIEVFYRRWFEAMLSMARRAIPNRSRDEAFMLDVVHDATLRIVRCIRPMETEAHVLNWTRLVVQSCALDRLRTEQRRRRRETARPIVEVNDDRDLGEQAEWLAAQIETLEPSLAQIFRLRFNEGWTLARIAGSLRTTTSQIDGRLRRAIATLRANAREAFDE